MHTTVRIKTVIDPSHELHLSLPADTPTGAAEVIVIVHPAPAATKAAPLASLRAFFAELDARPQSRPRSLAEIEAQIAADRASWG
jgi:hypothetical protein